jgi:hypothetical protein
MRIMTCLAVPVALLAVAPAATGAARGADGEKELAAAIGDRHAGQPVDCIEPTDVRSTRIIDGTAIVYDTGGRLYVNRPGGASHLRRDDVLVTRIEGGQLCRIDSIRLLDAATRSVRGFVVLGRFVPYERRR